MVEQKLFGYDKRVSVLMHWLTSPGIISDKMTCFCTSFNQSVGRIFSSEKQTSAGKCFFASLKSPSLQWSEIYGKIWRKNDKPAAAQTQRGAESVSPFASVNNCRLTIVTVMPRRMSLFALLCSNCSTVGWTVVPIKEVRFLIAPRIAVTLKW